MYLPTIRDSVPLILSSLGSLYDLDCVSQSGDSNISKWLQRDRLGRYCNIFHVDLYFYVHVFCLNIES